MRLLRDAVVTTALFLLYAVVFVPLGVLSRVVRDPLDRRPSARRPSYWHRLGESRPAAPARPRSAV
ncbi:hypothetical protein ACIQNG_12125 [Streptomyces sp. NPDC091377]|uniref:hypothetical protein n=1 Tax=Streptomyces sp. NPDC091377 TaxID=3365995 RepID=UPI0037FBDBA8